MNKLKDFLKDSFIGRKFNLIDDIFFKITGRYSNVWVIGNKIKMRFVGKKKARCMLPIVFIGGAPRSGTTLLQMILNSFNNFGGPYGEVCLLQDMNDKEVILKNFNFTIKEYNKIKKESKGDVIKFSDILLKKYSQNKKISKIVLKAPKNILFAKEFLKYFPNSKFINIIRDGRDSVISMEKYFFKRFNKIYSINYCAKIWVVSINSAKKVNQNKERFLDIKYEDLINFPEETSKNLAKFLEIKKIPNFKEYYKKIDVKKLHSHKNQVSKPLYKKSLGRWKKELNDVKKEIFKRIANKELIELKYEKNKDW